MRIQTHHTLTHKDTITNKDIIRYLLTQRGITDPNDFIYCSSPVERSLTDFGFTGEIDTLITLLNETKAHGKKIMVYTDYDADGITGGSILWETLYLLGYDALPYVPNRQTEGYGFSITALDKIRKEYNPGLIISVDHGITACDQIAYADSHGIAIVVTDHHTRKEELPQKARAIFHIPSLSGSAVAYYVAKEIFNRVSSPKLKNHQLLTSHFASDYLCLAAIGTIADLVPLNGPSRAIAKYGLKEFSSTKRVGLRQIMTEAKIIDKTIDTFHIGFIIAPRINAIGRLEHALDAVRLLCTKSESKAKELANRISSLNETRKDLVDTAVTEAVTMVESMKQDDLLPKILILRSDEWHEGIIGLIASKMVEKYVRPTIIICKSEQYLKGSARSLPTVNITEFLSKLDHHFENYGGHAQAAGLSITEDKYESFYKEACANAEKFSEQDLTKVIEADLAIPLSYLTLELAEELACFEPFGVGNPRPLFLCNGTLTDKRLMGQKKNHLKISLSETGMRKPLEIVAFGKGNDYENLTIGSDVQTVIHLDINEWNGRKTAQGKLVHWQ